LSEQEVDRGIASILLQQPAENASSSSGLVRAHQGRTPRQEQARIVRRIVQQRLENLSDLCISLQDRIAEAQNLTDERVVGMRSELALQRWNCFRVEFGTEAGQSPIAVQPRKIGLPCGSLLEKLGGLRKSRVF